MSLTSATRCAPSCRSSRGFAGAHAHGGDGSSGRLPCGGAAPRDAFRDPHGCPSHTVEDGAGIDDLDLTSLTGPAPDVAFPGPAPRGLIGWPDVAGQLEDLTPSTVTLFHTDWAQRFGTATFSSTPPWTPRSRIISWPQGSP